MCKRSDAKDMEIRQTGFSDACSSMDEFKKLLHEDYKNVLSDPQKKLKPLLDDVSYMLRRMDKRTEEYKDFTSRTGEILRLLNEIQDVERRNAEQALEFLEKVIISKENFKSNNKEWYSEAAETIRSLASSQEHSLRIYKDLTLKIHRLFEEVKGNRNWILTDEKENSLFSKLESKYQSWLPPEPHRYELLKRLALGEDTVKEESAGEEPMVYFIDGGSIYMSQVRYEPDIKNFHPASFKPGSTGRKYRRNMP